MQQQQQSTIASDAKAVDRSVAAPWISSLASIRCSDVAFSGSSDGLINVWSRFGMEWYQLVGVHIHQQSSVWICLGDTHEVGLMKN